MPKITIRQFLMYTNRFVPIYIEDEFQRYHCIQGTAESLLNGGLKEFQLECEIDYIRNVDGGYRNDDSKANCGIVLGIGIVNFETYLAC